MTRILTCLLTIGLLAALLVGCKKAPPQEMPVLEYPVVEVQQQSIPLTADFIGQTYGLFDIDIRARVEGFLVGRHFKEGDPVKEGQLLYTIDPDPFLQGIASAESDVASAQTMLVRAEAELNRVRPLAEINAVSQSDLDAAVAEYGASKASVEAAKAALRYNQIQLSYTRIKSPINGIIGKTEAKVGDFVGREPNPIVLNTVSRVDTVLVRFSISESQYLNLIKYDRARRAIQDELEEEENTLELILVDGSVFDQIGKLDFVDREINPTTGTLLIQASFPNPDGIIRPGQFARIRALIDTIREGILIPQRCIKEIQGVHSVMVVKDDNTIESRQIEIGPTQGNYRMVISGLEAGERIILEGVTRVSQGMTIKPNLQEFEMIKS